MKWITGKLKCLLLTLKIPTYKTIVLIILRGSCLDGESIHGSSQCSFWNYTKGDNSLAPSHTHSGGLAQAYGWASNSQSSSCFPGSLGGHQGASSRSWVLPTAQHSSVSSLPLCLRQWILPLVQKHKRYSWLFMKTSLKGRLGCSVG